MSTTTPAIPSGSRVALVVLLVLVVVSPWPFGGAHPLARWLITLVCLLTSGGIALVRLWRREGIEIPLPAAFAAGIFLFGLVQLIPLPPGIHRVVAPGSAAIWHPAVPAAAAVLGDVARPISIWPEATRRAVGLGIGIIALAVLAMPALRDRRWALRSAGIVVASGVAVAAYGLIARLVFGDKLYGVFAVPTVAPFGPFVNKNHFAGYVEMTALLALGVAVGLADEARRRPGFLGWAESRRAPRVVLAYGAFALLSVAVLVSLSRGGAVSLAAGMVAFLLLRPARHQTSTPWRRRGLGAMAVVSMAIAALAVLPPEARERLKTIGAGSRDLSTAFRAIVWRDSLQVIAASPLVGHGLGTFVDALPRFKTGAGDVLVEHAENDYIELFTEVGVAGLGLLVSCAFILSRAATQVSWIGKNGLRRGFVTGAVSALAAIAVHSSLDFNLRIPSGASVCVLLAAFSMSSGSAVRAGKLSALILTTICGALLLLTHSPPHQNRPGWLDGRVISQVSGGATPLRLRGTAAALVGHLDGRPADALAWTWLGWVRGSQGLSNEGAALARYGAQLEPERGDLQEFATRLEE